MKLFWRQTLTNGRLLTASSATEALVMWLSYQLQTCKTNITGLWCNGHSTLNTSWTLYLQRSGSLKDSPFIWKSNKLIDEKGESSFQT